MKCKKASYTAQEVCKVHNIYRGIMLVLVFVFLFLMHKYKVADRFIADITGGQLVVTDSQSYWSILLMIGKWLSGAFGVIFALMLAWDKVFKKKYQQLRSRRG